jgi:hypothetical protein
MGGLRFGVFRETAFEVDGTHTGIEVKAEAQLELRLPIQLYEAPLRLVAAALSPGAGGKTGRVTAQRHWAGPQMQVAIPLTGFCCGCILVVNSGVRTDNPSTKFVNCFSVFRACEHAHV